DGEISTHALIEYAAGAELLSALGPSKGSDPEKGGKPSKLAAPTFFVGAQKIVEGLDPQSERWMMRGDLMFFALKDLDEGRRAYLIALFQATYSKKYGPEFLERFMNNAPAGTAGAYLSMIEGTPPAEHRAFFEEDYLAKD